VKATKKVLVKKQPQTRKVRLKIDMVIEYSEEFRSLPDVPTMKALQDALATAFKKLHMGQGKVPKAIEILPGARFSYSLDWRKS
jgi:hypothetical protein